MADKKNIIDRRRIRKITGSFSWLDHRLITGGFLDDLPAVSHIALFFPDGRIRSIWGEFLPR